MTHNLTSWVVDNINKSEMSVLVGGHYVFPNQPDEFALNSIKQVNEIANRMHPVLLYSFVNDMRFDNLCNYGICSIENEYNKEESFLQMNVDTIDDLWKQSISEINQTEKKTGIIINEDFIHNLKNLLFTSHTNERYLAFSSYFIDNYKKNVRLSVSVKENISPLFYLAKACDQKKEIFDMELFEWAIDYFLYYFDKENFVPVSFYNAHIGCKTLFEKNIYNSSSKLIRKLHIRDFLPNLIVESDSSQITYKCKSYTGNDIVLRVENQSDSFEAINKCSAIIAALYYKIVKEKYDGKNMTIIYMVPSYDRSKVNLGAEAFFNIYYPYLQKIRHVKNLTIINIHWANSIGSSCICDIYTAKDLKTSLINI